MAGVFKNDKCTIKINRMNNRTGLIVYHYYHHHAMVERMASSMKEYGVDIDVFCMDNYHLVQNSNVKLSSTLRYFLSFLEKCKSDSILRLFRKFFSTYLFNNLFRHYNQIDFHAYSMDCLPLMHICEKCGIVFDITLWGSDVMRASDETLEKKKWGFEHCRYIKGSENLHQVVSEKYLDCFNGKFKTCYFGNSSFEVIDKVSESVVGSFRKKLLTEKENIVFTCGYNGSEGQKHLVIVDKISKLPIEIKKKVSFLFPMTYGASSEYISKVRQTLSNASVHFTIIDKYLNAEETAIIRLASDVVVNIQETDAFSASLKEHLYCNNVLIIGDWLDYVPLDKANVYYIKSSLSDLQTNISLVLSELPKYKGLCVGNHEKMTKLTSWSSVLPLWAESYNS